MSDTLVVVGAGPGLGRAVAHRFAREGVSVGLVARSADRLSDLVGELTSYDVPAHGAVGDIADPASLRAALGELRDRLGDPTVMVFNASEYVEGRPSDVDPEEMVRGLRVGVVGALVAAQVVAPAMRAAGRGTILLTGSQAADRPYVGAATVGVVKAGLRNLALSLAAELRPDGVQVATVTIAGMLSGPKALDAAEIADRFWEIHRQQPDAWLPETRFPG